jgi:acyl-lipid omega-6 desaturase (Delta-12 desaturase)
LISQERPENGTGSRPGWQTALSRYERPHTGKAAWQLVNTVIPYVALWAAAAILLQRGYAYWMVFPLIVLATGFHVRIFIFFHDCCHGCFLPSRRANRILGHITGVVTFTPFDDWKHKHALHHGGSGNLDRRGAGDVWTMTVDEYRAAPRRVQLGYRLYRNPFVLFVLGPFYLFFVAHRVAGRHSGPRERRSVRITNATLCALVGIAWLLGGPQGILTYLKIHLPIIALAGALGVWLFYVQHQYEHAYWADHSEWDPIRAALEGSSYYKLPKVLQWFSGNIGLHHIHHLRARIPNYHLQLCQDTIPEMQGVKPLTLLQSLRSLYLNLWDEQRQRMVSFRAAKTLVR